MAATPPSGSITSPCPLSRNGCSLSLTNNKASRWRRYLSVRQSLASSTAPRPRLPWYCSSFDSKRLNRVKASAVEPANPATILSLYSRRIFLAECLITDSPSVTCPSPARTTFPLRRTDKTVVDRISRFVVMSAILDYSSALSRRSCQGTRWSCTFHLRFQGVIGERRESFANSAVKFFFAGKLHEEPPPRDTR